jgi:hypothetical protein
MNRFEEHGRMFHVGRVLKLRFKIPNSSDLSFFCFAEDVEKLIKRDVYYVRIFLDKKQDEGVKKRE